MKSKVLSLILAITLLCGIMVPTAAFAEVNKGDEILIPAAATALQNPGSFNDVAAGNVSFANYANRQTSYTDNKGPIIQVSNKNGIGGANGGFAHFPITHNLTLTNSFTFEFEYFARNNVNVVLALGNMDVFVHFGGSGKVAFTDGSTLGYSELTLNTDTWNKIAFTFDGAKYSVYANDELVGTFDALKTDITGTETMKIGVFSGSKMVDSKPAIVAVDEIYAYQSAYEPAASPDPDPEPDVTENVIEIDHDQTNFKRSAIVTLTEEYVGCNLFIAFYNKDNELIGVAFKEIEEPGENIVTRDQSTVLNVTDEGKEQTEYGLTTSLAAIVWTADNQPTGIIYTINRK